MASWNGAVVPNGLDAGLDGLPYEEAGDLETWASWEEAVVAIASGSTDVPGVLELA